MTLSSSHDDFRYTYAAWSEAFAIFAKYTEVADLAAEHDVIYAGPRPSAVSVEDTERLEQLGWVVSDEFDTFRHYV